MAQSQACRCNLAYMLLWGL
jgi:hypothetical protein